MEMDLLLELSTGLLALSIIDTVLQKYLKYQEIMYNMYDSCKFSYSIIS